MKRSGIDRRSFLKTSAAAAAAVSLPTIIPSSVLGGQDKLGANEKVNVGIIGCGGRARYICKEGKDVKAFRLAALCDCFKPRTELLNGRLTNELKLYGPLKHYEDFREMIDKEKLDAVADRDHDPRPGLDHHSRHAGGCGRLYRKADVSDNLRGTCDGQRRAEV